MITMIDENKGETSITYMHIYDLLKENGGGLNYSILWKWSMLFKSGMFERIGEFLSLIHEVLDPNIEAMMVMFL